MVDEYSREFSKSQPQTNIIVSGGESVGLDKLLAGEAEIAMTSRKLSEEELKKAKEKSIDLEEQVIGWGGIVIITHPSNPVSELTVEQVRKLFTGEIANWKVVGGPNEPVSVMTVGEKREGTLDFMVKDFLKAPFGPNSAAKTYFRSIISAVSEDQKATGFVRMRNIVQIREKGQERRIKIMAVKKDESSPPVLPSDQTVADGSYPITRPYYLYIDRKSASQTALKFFQFCAGKNPRQSVAFTPK
jgi:phosphate transport system substrate-binding protein